MPSYSHALTPKTKGTIGLDYTTTELCLAIVHKGNLWISMKIETGGENIFFKIR